MSRGACAGLAFCLVVLSGCGHPPLRGGSEIAEGVWWRLNTLGDGERLPTDSDSVLVRVRVARPSDPLGSLFSTERWYGMAGAKGTRLFFGRLREGDSASVLMDARRLPWTELGASLPSSRDTGRVRMELSLRQVRSLAQSRAIAAELLAMRTEVDEQRILSGFLARSKEHWKEFMGVRYVLDNAKAKHKGPVIQSGQLITLSYIATFLDNGKVFDDQRSDGRSITFRLGDPDQVIKGLEIAAHVLPQQGGSGRFIIPAELAFGPTGSSSGIVPPWTPVMYDIRVVSVEQAAVAPSS
jgi:FKBP-type peptidyl-prolyl cis-trans isomerase